MTKAKKAPKRQRSDDPAQSHAFMAEAREIGADEEQSDADALMGKLSEKPPEPHTKQLQAKRRRRT